ncbi:MAG TPA: dephospho-CoA kinase [Rectinemataceae bacterium]|nr:dephospho-CoA kinase [Rectinemataceae bacterium]
MLLGLTGGYCAGKNAAAAILEKLGWLCIDVDRLGHEAIDRAQETIVARFGEGIIGPEGRIDRRALAAILFSDPAALAAQEAIIHPIAIELLDERIAAAQRAVEQSGGEARICINAALLYVAPQARRCDLILEIRAPLWIRLRRAKIRDGSGVLASLRRMLRQRGLWKKRRSIGPAVQFISNRGSLEQFERRLRRALDRAV